MADKETALYEPAAAGQPKPAPFQLPVRSANKQLNDSGAPKAAANANNPHGHYANVAQKSKLILPTALWILLIIAGLYFLTLLASLNRTLSTLDTLVELEQGRAASSEAGNNKQADHTGPQLHEHKGHQLPLSRAHAGAASLAERLRADHQQPDEIVFDLEFSDNDPMTSNEPPPTPATNNWPDLAPKASWLSFPAWASLEPGHARVGHKRQGEASSAMALPSLFGARPDEPAGPVAASIVVGSSQPLGFDPLVADESNTEMAGLMDTLIKRMLPIFNGFSDNSDDGDKVNKKEDSASHPTGPLVSAKIDKLNINFNQAAPSRQDDTESKTNSIKPIDRNDETGPIEKSIDRLVTKLVGSKHDQEPDLMMSSLVHQVDEREPLSLSHGPVLSLLDNLLTPFGLDAPNGQLIIDSSSPIGGAHRPKHGPDHHHHHHHQPAHRHGHHNNRRHRPLDGPMPFVITIDDIGSPIVDDIFHVGGGGQLFSQGTSSKSRRPSSVGQSPYEFVSAPESPSEDNMRPFRMGHHQRLVNDAPVPWNMLADDALTNAFMQDVLQPPVNRPISLDGSEPSSSFVFINSKPLAAGEQQELDAVFNSDNTGIQSDRKESSINKHVGDLFSLLLGPTLDSKLVVVQSQPGGGEDKNETLNKEQATIEKASNGPTATSQVDSTRANLQAGGSSPTPIDTLLSTQSPDAKDEHLQNEFESMVNTIMALPQSGGQSAPVRVDGASSSLANNSSSSGSPDGK